MVGDVRQLSEAEFPPLLSEMPDPPEHLFCRGTLPDPETYTYLTVVGTRAHSAYGKSVCESLIHGLAGTPIAIVSGLALGIDAIAHTAALQAGLPTIGIPGSGLDENVLYPATNRGIARDILTAGGALLSEFPPDTKARPEYFPQRNRIMAGIANAVLVIEATPRSGTRITARLALEYNRDVFAVPGSIFSETSDGAHELLKDGAALITRSADISTALGLTLETSAPVQTNLPDEQQRIYDALGTPQTKDALIQTLSLSSREANAHISQMELDGYIKTHGGVIYRA